MQNKNSRAVFDYRALRLLVGIIAFALPIVVSLLSPWPLSSISASYYTDARNAFVGMLFIVSAFLWAYNGHTLWQGRLSKLASLAAVVVAVMPTECDTCSGNGTSTVHYLGATTLFAVLAYFCFSAFRYSTKGQTGKKLRRDNSYLACGWMMVLCMAAIGVAKLTLAPDLLKASGIVYFGESFALAAFGVSWIVSGKTISFFVDEEEKSKVFGK